MKAIAHEANEKQKKGWMCEDCTATLEGSCLRSASSMTSSFSGIHRSIDRHCCVSAVVPDPAHRTNRESDSWEFSGCLSVSVEYMQNSSTQPVLRGQYEISRVILNITTFLFL